MTDEGYDAIAAADLDPTGSPWGDSHFQRHYAWPAAREVLPDVSGERVLLAGCGRGDHVEWFRERGADVVGLDASERALETARERFDGVPFHHADLADPLPFDEGAFDLAFSHLVLGHVREWAPVFREFARVLADGGALAFVTVHPAYLRDRHDVADAYRRTTIEVSWPGGDVTQHYRPTSAAVGALLEAGFQLEAFEEPPPRESLADHLPERYAAARERPEVLCVRARA